MPQRLDERPLLVDTAVQPALFGLTSLDWEVSSTFWWRHDRDDLALDERAGPFNLGVGRQQSGCVPFGGSDVDRVGVAQRPLREGPSSMDVKPRRRLNDNFECLCRLESQSEVCGPQGVVWPVRGGAETGHDLEREMPRRRELLSRWHSCQCCTRCDTSRTRIGNDIDDQRRVDDQLAGRPLNCSARSSCARSTAARTARLSLSGTSGSPRSRSEMWTIAACRRR